MRLAQHAPRLDPDRDGGVGVSLGRLIRLARRADRGSSANGGQRRDGAVNRGELIEQLPALFFKVAPYPIKGGHAQAVLQQCLSGDSGRRRGSLRRGFGGCLACTRAPAPLGRLPGTRLYVLDAVALPRRFTLSP